jgi:hypothetical protein
MTDHRDLYPLFESFRPHRRARVASELAAPWLTVVQDVAKAWKKTTVVLAKTASQSTVETGIGGLRAVSSTLTAVAASLLDAADRTAI